MGIRSDFIMVPDGISRINLKLKSIDGTEINGSGPEISEAAVAELMEKLEVLGEEDVLVLAGSIPSSMPDDIYRRILKRLQGRGVTAVVDATKDLLLNVLEYRPFLVKPNNHELGEIFQVELWDRKSVVSYARKLQEMGAQNVLVSMAGDGSLLVTEGGSVYQMGVARGVVKNSVGAGDSMVAGFLAGYLERKDYAHALRMGTAAGGATAFSDGLGTKDEIMRLYRELEGQGMV